MNRLPAVKASKFELSSSFDTSAPSSAVARKSVGARRRERTAAPEFSLFVPMHYERRYAYPLLVWLHDAGGSERELRQLMPHVSMRNYLAAAVRGTSPAVGRPGYAWEDSPDTASEAAERVQECIDAAQRRYHVHAERVFIAGQGRGGTMALRLALQHPEWFAGAISLGGPLPQGGCPLQRVNRARRLPLLVAACLGSRAYPESRVASDLRLLHAAGFALALRRYPGNDELTTVMLSDMDRWIMSQVCPAATAAAT